MSSQDEGAGVFVWGAIAVAFWAGLLLGWLIR